MSIPVSAFTVAAPPSSSPLVHADHPFVVKLFFCFQSRHNLYLVMEYLAGGDLHALLKAVGRFEEQLACVYLAEIVLGLEYLHEVLGTFLSPMSTHEHDGVHAH